ncbi:hypothetical protein [Oleidesulfovibrio sp.]|uniref:hypothetical protein n=1 Tax=Oleidesulfovibrio sp. TaxID=2909707 RepID=UPI003A83F6D3
MRTYKSPITSRQEEVEPGRVETFFFPVAGLYVGGWTGRDLRPVEDAMLCICQPTQQEHEALLSAGCIEVTDEA